VGEGYAKLGEFIPSEAALSCASQLAEEYGFNQLSFTIEDAKSRVQAATRHSDTKEKSIPTSLTAIAENLSALRQELVRG
jgi:hypothetical protein